MAEAVRTLHPGGRVEEVFDVEFLSPFKFYRSEPRKVYVHCFLTAEGGDIIGHCTLFGTRKLHGKEGRGAHRAFPRQGAADKPA